MNRLVFALLLAAGCGPVATEPIPPDLTTAVARVDPPEVMTDGLGNVWIRQGLAPTVPQGDMDPEISDRTVPYESMTREDLAKRLMPKRWYAGYEYVPRDLPYALADAILHESIDEKEAPADTAPSIPRGMVEEDESRTAVAHMWGADTRTQRRANLSYPYSTNVLLTEAPANGAFPGGNYTCSATMIGPTTAVTAAHCVYSGSAWYPMRQWAAGVDALDANPVPFGYWNGCYWVTIPGYSGNGDVIDDYAVIDFGCGSNPGNSTGWLGLLAISASALEDGRLGYLFGYPGGNNCECDPDTSPNDDCSSCDWPTIWGTARDEIWADSSRMIGHQIDNADGQSGSGVYVFSGSSRFVVGIHSGTRFDGVTTDGVGRRVTKSLITWISNYSSLNCYGGYCLPEQ